MIILSFIVGHHKIIFCTSSASFTWPNSKNDVGEKYHSTIIVLTVPVS